MFIPPNPRRVGNIVAIGLKMGLYTWAHIYTNTMYLHYFGSGVNFHSSTNTDSYTALLPKPQLGKSTYPIQHSYLITNRRIINILVKYHMLTELLI